MKLLDRAAERLLDRLRLRVRAHATSGDQGAHRSDALSQGLEFADHRQYVPGDDVRHIDWKAFARHQHLVIRQFEEERDARIYLMVDASPSMTRGEPAKADVARRMAAAFGYVGMKQLDRVQVVPFASQIGQPSRAMRSRADMLELEQFLESAKAEGVTAFPQTVRSFAERFSRRGLVVVVSDLMTPEGWEDGFRVLGRLGHQLVVIRVTCAEDDKPDFKGEMELHDSETGERLRLRVSPDLVASYKKVMAEHVEGCRRAAIRVGGRLVEAPVDLPTEKLIRIALPEAA
jgi:uncharacterized protein (DUF58 family)